MLTPTDILDEVRRAFEQIPHGKASHNRHWINAYGLLALLPEPLQARLVDERCPPGAGGGEYYSAARVVSGACEMLQERGELERAYYAPVNATYTIADRTFEAGYEISAIFRRLP